MIRENAMGLKLAQRKIAGLSSRMDMLFLLSAGLVVAQTETISPSIIAKVRAPASEAR
jgi:hypothetical protein